MKCNHCELGIGVCKASVELETRSRRGLNILASGPFCPVEIIRAIKVKEAKKKKKNPFSVK